MKRSLLIICVLLFSCFEIIAQSKEENNLDSTFLGEWQIDLRPTPEAEAYFQPFVVSGIAENNLEGTFYGSPIENGLINSNWDKLYFAFTTRDSTSEYYHSGYLINGKLFGISYCPNRNFTAPWTGIKK